MYDSLAFLKHNPLSVILNTRFLSAALRRLL